MSAIPLAFRHQRGKGRVGSYKAPFTGTDRLAVGAAGGVAGWGLVAQGGVPPVMVVVMLPVADDHAGLGQRPEAIDVEAFVADAGVERFDVAVAPRLAGWDEV